MSEFTNTSSIFSFIHPASSSSSSSSSLLQHSSRHLGVSHLSSGRHHLRHHQYSVRALAKGARGICLSHTFPVHHPLINGSFIIFTIIFFNLLTQYPLSPSPEHGYSYPPASRALSRFFAVFSCVNSRLSKPVYVYIISSC